ncbi:polysaccharide biosynthesis/export family protein [Prosthecomicrobium sp. N25]|uniref:polysaccharide biosynthesis/export family protein n=1 Tax=Prosthecomicrobium sp. N25 TaxID=3129254 RepID=UPI00307699C7
MATLFRVLVLMVTAALLAGCSTLSRDGPDDQAIVSEATATVGQNPATPVLNYALVDLSRDVLEHVIQAPSGSLLASFGAGRAGAPELRVGAGDSIQVTIFESEAGGLFIPREAGSRPGNFVTFPPQLVDRSGSVSVPYAGQIQAAGRTLKEIQRDIELKLANRAIEPQAVVSFIQQRASDVSVVGDVNAPNKISLNPAGERVLDLISRAGGIRYPGYETFVTLQRGKRKSTVYFKELIENPGENIYVAPGDTIYVYREQRSFLAFGASGGNGLFFFEAERVSWAEGVAKAGGLNDDRADPAQAFLYRIVDRRILAKLGVDLTQFPADKGDIPVIFRANFRQPAMFFLAQQFPLQNQDILYVSNADSVELYKFLGLLNNTSATIGNVPQGLARAKQSIGDLGKK